MSTTPHPDLRYRLMVIAAAALFSTGGAAIKAASFGGWQIASFRSGIAAIFLLIVLPEARRQWKWRMVSVAIFYAATLVTFVLANRLTTAASAIFLQSTAPLYVLLLGPLLLHEPLRGRDVMFMAAIGCGIALLLVSPPDAGVTAPDPRRGNLFAIASGLAYAFMLVGLRWFSRSEKSGSAIATVAMGNLLACVVALPLAIPVPPAGAKDVAVLLYLGILQIGVAYFCLVRGMRHVPAVQATTLLMAEPALSPVWTWIFHRESPGVWALAGGAVIIVATLWNTWRGEAKAG